MKALVTGGRGFLGRSLSRALLERGWSVRTLARGEPSEAAEGLDHHRGDIRDPSSVSRAAEGCDLVFHVAAKVGAAGEVEEFRAINVEGTRNVLAAARSRGLRGVVYTSTPSVVFGEHDLEGVDESIPYAERFEAHYPATKAEAERLVLDSSSPACPTVALRPHIVWGPGDTSLLPRLLERAPTLRRISGPPKKTDITFIDDAVAAHVLAADALLHAPETVQGRAYFVSSGEPVEIWSFIDRLLEAAGRPPIARTVPASLALTAGWAFETSHRLLRRAGEPRLSRWIVRELTRSHWFDISAARRDLGYTPRIGLDEGLARLRASLQAERA